MTYGGAGGYNITCWTRRVGRCRPGTRHSKRCRIVCRRWSGAPEGQTIEISRNVFGKPSPIRRRNADSSVTLTRSYVYNAYQQFC